MAMDMDMDAESFQEKQRELCLLSSFISEHEKWLESLLKELKWSKESLQGGDNLVRCHCNEHHYVPPKSLEAHTKKCFYASRGADIAESTTVPLMIDKDSLYNTSTPMIEIDPATERAVLVCAKDPDLYKERDQPARRAQGRPDSVEDSTQSGLEVSSLQPQQIISYIKSWRKVPLNWTSVLPSSLNLNQLKGWLFHNLPREHAHSSSIGGEIIAVDTIMNSLLESGTPSITPNKLVESLRPLLRAGAGPFVLSLWKQLHISHTQSQHGIPDSVVEDTAPMPLAQLLILQRGAAEAEKEETPLVYHKIKELSEQDSAMPTVSDTLPLPMDAVFFTHTPTERRVMYDYAVEAGQVERPKKKRKIDPDLYRDDEAALKAKLKALAQQEQSGGSQDGKSFQEILRERKEKRDYKRRRQKYRAKNVHITRRKTSEIFRDIINNRMSEIMESLGPEGMESADIEGQSTHKDVEVSQDSSAGHSPRDQDPHDKEVRRGEEWEKGKRRSRSRSRERRHSHKKHKKHKSHKHSSSREHKKEKV